MQAEGVRPCRGGVAALLWGTTHPIGPEARGRHAGYARDDQFRSPVPPAGHPGPGQPIFLGARGVPRLAVARRGGGPGLGRLRVRLDPGPRVRPRPGGSGVFGQRPGVVLYAWGALLLRPRGKLELAADRGHPDGARGGVPPLRAGRVDGEAVFGLDQSGNYKNVVHPRRPPVEQPGTWCRSYLEFLYINPSGASSTSCRSSRSTAARSSQHAPDDRQPPRRAEAGLHALDRRRGGSGGGLLLSRGARPTPPCSS